MIDEQQLLDLLKPEKFKAWLERQSGFVGTASAPSACPIARYIWTETGVHEVGAWPESIYIFLDDEDKPDLTISTPEWAERFINLTDHMHTNRKVYRFEALRDLEEALDENGYIPEQEDTHA